MMYNTLLSLFLATSSVCPTIKPMTDFNTTEYIRSTWYIQQQQITGYQPNSTLNCVAQTLNESSYHVPFFNGPVLSVFNYANENMPNGASLNPNNFTLCARQVNTSLPSEILNGPCFLPNFFAGPYWVIDAGPSSHNYTWAIVSGGPPTVQYPDGNCSTSLSGVNGSGLWLFTRDSYSDNVPYYIHIMRERLQVMGYSLSQLLNVTQRGCNYTDAFIKN